MTTVVQTQPGRTVTLPGSAYTTTVVQTAPGGTVTLPGSAYTTTVVRTTAASCTPEAPVTNCASTVSCYLPLNAPYLALILISYRSPATRLKLDLDPQSTLPSLHHALRSPRSPKPDLVRLYTALLPLHALLKLLSPIARTRSRGACPDTTTLSHLSKQYVDHCPERKTRANKLKVTAPVTRISIITEETTEYSSVTRTLPGK